ncbi:MAG: plastocyanin/azurin family copper-binding protein [Bacteroidia bacterium]
MLKRFYQFAIVGAIAFAMVACGGEKPTNTETETTEPAVAETTEPAAETEETTPAETEEVAAGDMEFEAEIELKAIGEDMSAIAYEPSEFTMPAYTNVKLNFTNTATMAGMNHNAVLIPMDDVVLNEVRAAGMKAGGPSFDPTDDRIIAKTSMLNPGENTSIVFETPGPGQYYILCTFPGHSAMLATVTVE